jgi:outer membrane protein, adhesin transport system
LLRSCLALAGLALAPLAWAQLPAYGRGPVAPPPGVTTLADAVRDALDWQPEMRAMRATRRVAEGAVDEARGGYLPSVDVTLGRGRERSDNVTTRPGERTLDRVENELTVSQLLFDTGATSSQVNRAEARREGASLQVIAGAESLAQRTAQAYLEVLRMVELIRIGEENVAAHERTLKQVTTLADGGVGRRADAVQVSGRLAQANSSLAQLRGQLEQANAAYRHLVGRAPGALVAPRAEFPRLERGVALLIEETIVAHPAIRAAEREREAAQADREFARSRLGPRVTFDVGVTQNRDLDGVRGVNADAMAMVRLRQNLFRGGSDDARIRQAEARVDEANAGLARARNDVERELRLAHETYRAERARLPALAEHARASEAVVEAYTAQFRLGQRTLFDLLNAEAERFSSRSNLVTGEYSALAAGYRALAALGVLIDSLGLAMLGNGPGAPQ